MDQKWVWRASGGETINYSDNEWPLHNDSELSFDPHFAIFEESTGPRISHLTLHQGTRKLVDKALIKRAASQDQRHQILIGHTRNLDVTIVVTYL